MEPRTYKVTKIDGDYAHLLNVDTGDRNVIYYIIIVLSRKILA